MKKKINEKGFTLVELLAVIVVLAIVMALAVVGITKVIDDTRKNSLVTDALSFLDGAHQLVSSDNISNLFGDSTNSYAPTCKNNAGSTTIIPIAAINLDKGGVKSPWGNPYKKGNTTTQGDKTGSYIQVTSAVDPTTLACTFSYAIYLTDGVYSIGNTQADAVDTEGSGKGLIPEDQINASKVKIDPNPPA